jgi:hypothetical protein
MNGPKLSPFSGPKSQIFWVKNQPFFAPSFYLKTLLPTTKQLQMIQKEYIHFQDYRLVGICL